MTPVRFTRPTALGFKEVGLYLCNHCGNIRSHQDQAEQGMYLVCTNPSCRPGLNVTLHVPLCIDFARQQFVVPDITNDEP